METSRHFDSAAKALGKRILSEFSSGGDREILLQWVTQYVAELMLRAESETNFATKCEIEKECFQTIMKLWSLRSFYPQRTRPFEHAEKAAETLAILSPSSSGRLYFDRAKVEDAEEDGNIDWHAVAVAFDGMAISFMRLCLNRSLDNAKAKLLEWLEAAGLVEDPPPADAALVKNMLETSSDEELEDLADPQDRTAKVVAKLDGIIGALTELRSMVEVGTQGHAAPTPFPSTPP